MSGKVEFANFVCKFGDNNLLDLAKDIVIPSFFCKEKRTYGDTRFIFNDVQLINVNGLGLLAGRIIKDTLLKRDQIYDDEKGIIKNSSSLESAPSAIFVLILNNHKLIYFDETSYAPKITEFRNTIKKFINNKWVDYINERHSEYKRLNIKKKKSEVKEEVGKPDINIIPLQDEEDLSDFIQQLHRVNRLILSIYKRNDEYDEDEFIDGISKSHNVLGSNKTELTYSAGVKDSQGLFKNHIMKIIGPPIKKGFITIKLEGIDQNGLVVKRISDEIKARSSFIKISDSVADTALKLLEIYKSKLPYIDNAINEEAVKSILSLKYEN